MYHVPDQSDFERNLERIVQRMKDDALTYKPLVISDFASHGVANSNRMLFALIQAFEKFHSKMIKEAMYLITGYVSRSTSSPSELAARARAKLEDAAEELLVQVPEAGLPETAEKMKGEYRDKFRAEREGALRDVETGFIGGRDVTALNGPVFNNITVTNSAVGAINTGNVKKIDVSLTQLQQAGRGDASDALKVFTEAILNSDLPNTQKNALIEQVAFLGEQATLDATDQKPALIKPILAAVTQAAGTVSAIAGAWQAAETILRPLLGL